MVVPHVEANVCPLSVHLTRSTVQSCVTFFNPEHYGEGEDHPQSSASQQRRKEILVGGRSKAKRFGGSRSKEEDLRESLDEEPTTSQLSANVPNGKLNLMFDAVARWSSSPNTL